MPVLNNARHERFCLELLAGKTADKAYALAGYKPNRKNASRLRTKEDISARLAELAEAAAQGAVMTANEVLVELSKIGRANMLDYMRTGPDGDPVFDLGKITRNQAAALIQVTVEDFIDGRGEDAREVRRITFKLADKRAALVELGKHHKLFSERHEHDFAIGLADRLAAAIARVDGEEKAPNGEGRQDRDAPRN